MATGFLLERQVVMKLSPFPQSLIVLALAALLIGCADEREESSAPSPTEGAVYKIPVEDLKTGQILAKNASVHCEEGKECSPSVGLLGIAYGDKNAGQCSASLIGDNIVVTNSHCVPDDLKKVGASCNKRIWLHFVPDARYESVLECDQVLAVSIDPGSTKSPDYAVLKMKQSSARPKFNYSRDGFQNQETIKLHRVNPIHQKGKMSGALGTSNCQAKYDTSVVERFFDPYALVSLFVNCKVIPGNSGGPIQAQDGKIRGVIFAFVDHDFLRERAARTPYTEMSESLENLNLGSNFACLDDDFFGQAPSFCRQESDRWDQKKKQIVAQLDNAVETEFYREMAKRLSPELQTKISFRPVLEKFGESTNILGAGTEVKATVACIKRDLGSSFSFSISLPDHWVIVEKFTPFMEKKLTLQSEGATVQYQVDLTRDGRGYVLRSNLDKDGPTPIKMCQSQ